MTPDEIARTFQSASATCRGDRCPYASECKGTRETCSLKEVSMSIRAMLLEIEEARRENELLKQGVRLLVDHIQQLERINAQYYKIISTFQNGYRPKTKLKKRRPYKKRKKSLVEMDGDERYAMPEEPKPPKPPVVII